MCTAITETYIYEIKRWLGHMACRRFFPINQPFSITTFPRAVLVYFRVGIRDYMGIWRVLRKSGTTRKDLQTTQKGLVTPKCIKYMDSAGLEGSKCVYGSRSRNSKQWYFYFTFLVSFCAVLVCQTVLKSEAIAFTAEGNQKNVHSFSRSQEVCTPNPHNVEGWTVVKGLLGLRGYSRELF